MKNIFTLYLFVFGALLTSTTVQAQCPEFTCPQDTTLYLTASSCTVEYTYDLPTVTDFCHNSTVFSFTGEPQMWVVPAEVTEILVNSWGASGGHGSGPVYELNMGGKGAFAGGRLSVTPGDTLYVYVGEKGQDSQLASIAEGGWNGGGAGGMDTVYTGNGAGGGGGATDIRIGGNELANRILVAAGGGGASKNANGGAGGAETGVDGIAVSEGRAGLGATDAQGGSVFFTDRGAAPGELGLGGNGSTGRASWGGGGGGAGYYGGGGGTATQDHNYGHSGSGGGGSSYVDGMIDGDMQADQRIGNGLAVIYYSNPEAQTAYLADGPASGTALGVGNSTITFAANGVFDTITCSHNVMVLDTISPVAIAQNITVTLDENDEATIQPEDVDNGSSDNCGITGMTLNQQFFDQNDLGEVTLVLTVEDASGNITTATALATVERPPQELVQERIPFNADDDDDDTFQMTRRNHEETTESEGTYMTIYPNPTSNRTVEVSVELPESWEHAYLEVYSSTGQQVIRQFVPMIMPKDRMRLPVDRLDAGVYLVQLSTDTQSLTQRLVVK